ncbi:cysteine desulfurase family protein [Corynebacterium freneyi]|uniref:cysteine desulfurase family protein n=1 Tax=Corynebacterium freneyi TaxID=134034 RepID=UPI00254D7B39|nr:cysteine desulfurase family protein [Corynebacterium freneyi]MDK8767307.1 cysteine desulfurase family protein [Corynebacterium freneyi]
MSCTDESRTTRPRHHLDHAATSPLRPEAREAMIAALGAGNPNSQYAEGRAARKILEEARESIAADLGAEPVEVVFVSGGTEADNLGLRGLYLAAAAKSGAPGTVVTTPVEHDAIRKTAAHLAEHHGARVVEAPVDASGRVSVDGLRKLCADAAVADAPHHAWTCQWANNETGAIQPVDQFIAAAADHGAPVHVDAVQAVGHVPVHFGRSGAATLAASAHKFGGPRGIGALLVRRSTSLTALNAGGGQERGLRSGTPDVAAAAGMAAALRTATAAMEEERRAVVRLRDRLLDGIRELDGIVVHTTEPALPGHVHVSVTGAEGDSLIMLLDAGGISAATGSACAAGVNRASHVLEAMGVDVAVSRGALRLTLGWDSTAADVDAVLSAMGDTVARARAAGMA